MSIVICEHCDRVIDSDDDPDCFVETGNMRRLEQTTILCENCRERAWERQFEGEPPESAQEQYERAWREKQRLR